MPSAFRFALPLSLVVVLACNRAHEQAPTQRVALPKTDSLPAMTLAVPMLMERPLALGTSTANPGGGYAIVGADQIGSPDVFGAQIRVERYAGQQPVCSGEWVSDRRDALEVKSCAPDNVTAVVIPHPGGDIHCWSRWQLTGELTPARRGLAEAIDASCTTLAIE